jgi:hypothetical protein
VDYLFIHISLQLVNHSLALLFNYLFKEIFPLPLYRIRYGNYGVLLVFENASIHVFTFSSLRYVSCQKQCMEYYAEIISEVGLWKEFIPSGDDDALTVSENSF